MSQDGFFGIVRNLKDEQERIQRKTFTKWVNSILINMRPPLVIKDMMTDFRSGIVLLKLLEALTDTEFKKDEPKNMQRIHMIQNVKRALDYLETTKKIRLVNINASDVVDGKPAIVLGLVWTLILHFQIEEQEEYILRALGLENDPNARIKGKSKQAMIAWSKNTLNDKYGLEIKDFGESWRDGKAFSALVHNLDPNLMDMKAIEGITNNQRLENAFNVAEQGLGIPKLLDAEDVNVLNPDEKSIMTYVAQFLKTDHRKSSVMVARNNAELFQKFTENVHTKSKDPRSNNNFDVFCELLEEKESAKELLEYLVAREPDNEANFKKEYCATEATLRNWQQQLDQQLPGEAGSIVGKWLANAEQDLDKPVPLVDSPDFNDAIRSELQHHKALFANENQIREKLQQILANPPENIPRKQLEAMQQRLDHLKGLEPKKVKQLEVLALQADLKDQSDQLNNKINKINKPIGSLDELMDNIQNLQTSDDKTLDQYNKQLENLIELRANLCEQDPEFQEKYAEYLDKTIKQSQLEISKLPDKISETKSKLENLSQDFNDVKIKKNLINDFLDELEEAKKSDNLPLQRSILNRIPEIFELAKQTNQKIDEMSEHCTPELLRDLHGQMNELTDNLQQKNIEVVEQAEMQEQKIVAQQQAAKLQQLQSIKSSGDNQLQKADKLMSESIGPIDKELELCTSSSGVKNAISQLEQKRDKLKPQMEETFKEIQETIKKLHTEGDEKQAEELSNKLEEIQRNYHHQINEKIPKDLEALKSMNNVLIDLEGGLDNLDNASKEGSAIRLDLKGSKIPENKENLVIAEENFVKRKKDLEKSIEKDNELLKNLQDLSEKSGMKIDLEPLKAKISASEKSIQDVMNEAEEHLTATKNCNNACANVNAKLNDLTNQIAKTSSSPANEMKAEQNSEETQKIKLDNIKKLNGDLENLEELIVAVNKQREQSKPFLSPAELSQFDQKIVGMNKQKNQLERQLSSATKDTEQSLDQWKSFKGIKDDLSQQLDEIDGDLEKQHQLRQGSHGENLEDKQELLNSNEKKLQDLKQQKKKLENLQKLSDNIGSEKAKLEANNLLKSFDSQISKLENKINENQKDVDNHLKFEENQDSFKSWQEEAKRLAEEVKSTPNDKEGLARKGKLLEKLKSMKSTGDSKFKEVKAMSEVVMSETSPKSREQIAKEIKEEELQLHEIFQVLQSEDSKVSDRLTSLSAINNEYDEVLSEIELVEQKYQKVLQTPAESLEAKQRQSKDLQQLSKIIQEKKMNLDNMKQVSRRFSNINISGDLMKKISSLEGKDLSLIADIDSAIERNEQELQQGKNLEDSAKQLEDLMFDLEKQLTGCSNIHRDSEGIDDNIGKLDKLKSKLPNGKAQLEKIIKMRKDVPIPPKLEQLCEQVEQKYFELEEELQDIEKDLTVKKTEWKTFEATKSNMDQNLNEIQQEMGSMKRKNPNNHAGSCEEKEQLLEQSKALLQNLINKEGNLKDLLDKSANLTSNSPNDAPKRTTNLLCKQYEKLTDELMTTVKQAEEDLRIHKQFDKDFDKMKQESQDEMKKIQLEIAKQPNTKEGLENKIKLSEKLKQIQEDKMKELFSLEQLKNKVVEHSSVKTAKEMEQDFEKFSKSLNQGISESLDQERKLLSTMDEVNKTETQLEQMFDKLNKISNERKALQSPENDSMESLENNLEQFQNLDLRMKELNSQIEQLQKSTARNSQLNEMPAIKQKLNQLVNLGATAKDDLALGLNRCDNQHQNSCKFQSALSNFQIWLGHTQQQLDDQRNLEKLDLSQLKQSQQKLKQISSNVNKQHFDQDLQQLIDQLNDSNYQQNYMQSMNHLTQLKNQLDSQQSDTDQQIQLIESLAQNKSNLTNLLNQFTNHNLGFYSTNKLESQSELLNKLKQIQTDFNTHQSEFDQFSCLSEQLKSLPNISKQILQNYAIDKELSLEKAELNSNFDAMIMELNESIKSTDLISNKLSEIEKTIEQDSDSIKQMNFKESDKNKIDNLINYLDELSTDKNDKLDESLNELAKDIELLESENVISSDFTDLKNQLMKLKKDKSNLVNEVKKCKKDATGKRDEISELESNLDTFCGEISALDDEFQRFKSEEPANLRERIGQKENIQNLLSDSDKLKKNIGIFLLSNQIDLKSQQKVEQLNSIEGLYGQIKCKLDESKEQILKHEKMVKTIDKKQKEIAKCKSLLIEQLNHPKLIIENNIEAQLNDELVEIEESFEELKELSQEVSNCSSNAGKKQIGEDLKFFQLVKDEVNDKLQELKEKRKQLNDLTNRYDDLYGECKIGLDQLEQNIEKLFQTQENLQEKTQTKQKLIGEILPNSQKLITKIDVFKEVCYEYLNEFSDREKSKEANDIFYRASELGRQTENLIGRINKAVEDHEIYENCYDELMGKVCELLNWVNELEKACKSEKISEDKLGKLNEQLGQIIQLKEDTDFKLQELEEYSHRTIELTNKSGREIIKQQLSDVAKQLGNFGRSINDIKLELDKYSLKLKNSQKKLDELQLKMRESDKIMDNLKGYSVKSLDEMQENSVVLQQNINDTQSLARAFYELEKSQVNINLEEELVPLKIKLKALENIQEIIGKKQEKENEILTKLVGCERNCQKWLEKLEKEFINNRKPYSKLEEMTLKLQNLNQMINVDKLDEKSNKIREIKDSISAVVNNFEFSEVLTKNAENLLNNIEEFFDKLEKSCRYYSGVQNDLKDHSCTIDELKNWIKKSERFLEEDFGKNNSFNDIGNQLDSFKKELIEKRLEIDNTETKLFEMTSHEDISPFSILLPNLSTNLAKMKQSNFMALEQLFEKISKKISKECELSETFENYKQDMLGALDEFEQFLNKDLKDVSLTGSYIDELKLKLANTEELYNSLTELMLTSEFSSSKFQMNKQLSEIKCQIDRLKLEMDKDMKEFEKKCVMEENFQRLSDMLERWLGNTAEHLSRFNNELVPNHPSLSQKQLDLDSLKSFSIEVNDKQRSFDQLGKFIVDENSEQNSKRLELLENYDKQKSLLQRIMEDLQMSLSGKEEFGDSMNRFVQLLASCKTELFNLQTEFDEIQSNCNEKTLEQWKDNLKQRQLGFNKTDTVQKMSGQLNEVKKYAQLFHRSGYDKEESALTQLDKCKTELDRLLESFNELFDRAGKFIERNQSIIIDYKQFRDWLDNSASWFATICQNAEVMQDQNELKQIANNLRILLDDIVEHKVYLSRIKTQMQSMAEENPLPKSIVSIDEIEDQYNTLHSKCREYSEKFNTTIKLMGNFDLSRSSVLNWIEANTQVLLKCSDYTMNQNQVKSKLMMIENLERDMEEVGQTKLVECLESGEELLQLNEDCLGSTGRLMIQGQIADLKQDWAEMNRQLNQLSSGLRSTNNKSEIFRQTAAQLTQWLDDIDTALSLHSGNSSQRRRSSTPGVIEHDCLRRRSSAASTAGMGSFDQNERIKSLIAEMDRHREELNKAANIADELTNPAIEMEYSQLQSRFNKLYNQMKDKVDKADKQMAELDKLKDQMEDLEKWIFKTSIKMINENNASNDLPATDSNQDIYAVIDHANQTIESILVHEPEILKFQKIIEDESLANRDKQTAEDFVKLNSNFTNLKKTALNKREHILECYHKWNDHRKLLESTKDFIDNEYPHWKTVQIQSQSLMPASGSSNNFIDKQTEEQIFKLNEMQKKLKDSLKDIEKSALECDGIPSVLANALSKSNLQPTNSIDSELIPGSKSSSLTVNSSMTPKQVLSSLFKETYDKVEDTLKNIEDEKYKIKSNQSEWNIYTKRRDELKEWMKNNAQKYHALMKSLSNPSELNLDQKQAMKNEQLELETKQDELKQLLERFSQLSNGQSLTKEPILSGMQRELTTLVRQMGSVVNRENKQVEANFTDDEQINSSSNEMIIPKVAVPSQTLSFRLNSQNSACQTPRNFQSQTSDAKSIAFPSDKNSRHHKNDILREIKKSIRNISRDLEKSKEEEAYRTQKVAATLSSSSPRPPNSYRTPSQESVRKNIPIPIPIPSPTPLTKSLDFHSPRSDHPNQPFTPTQPLDLEQHQHHIPHAHEEFYVPTKHKWHEFDSFLSSTPRLNELPQQRATASSTATNNIHTPSRQFQVNYNTNPNQSTNHNPVINSKPQLVNSRPNSSRSSQKTAQLKAELDRVGRDAKDLKKLSESLRNYGQH